MTREPVKIKLSNHAVLEVEMADGLANTIALKIDGFLFSVKSLDELIETLELIQDLLIPDEADE